MGHRLFFIKTSQSSDYIQTHCNNHRKTFHFACRQWYLYNNPRYTYLNSNKNNSIFILIFV